MIPLAPHLTAYLRQRLAVERAASPNTCATYAYAYQLLVEFAGQRLGVAPSDLHLEHLDAPLVLAFLEHLQKDRGNGPRTRNARLAAIRSFMRFVEHRVPSALDQICAVLAIPEQRTDHPLVPHLDEQEVEALLNVPDPTTQDGIRDRALLLLAITSGLRVSEIVALRTTDVDRRGKHLVVLVRGKGGRERELPLWKEVATKIEAWIAIRPKSNAPELFLNRWKARLTRSGVEYILSKHTQRAAKRCPRLARKRVSPHVLRHTCAIRMLRATGDVRKVALWLGHCSPQTTEIYLQVDPAEKLRMLGKIVPPALRPGTFQPAEKLIAALQGRSGLCGVGSAKT